jgi:hypothetical protein
MRFLPLAALCGLCALPAHADCAAEIDALFDGALDSFARPPHHQLMTILGPGGATEMQIDQWVWDPLRYASHVRGQPQYTLILDQEMWQAASLEGPWTALGTMLPGDRTAWQKRIDADRRANVTEVECFGTVDLNGVTARGYSFRTKTEPDDHGVWFGAHMTLFVGPQDRVLRWEFRDNVAHYQPEPDDKVNVTDFDYAGAVPIPDPES